MTVSVAPLCLYRRTTTTVRICPSMTWLAATMKITPASQKPTKMKKKRRRERDPTHVPGPGPGPGLRGHPDLGAHLPLPVPVPAPGLAQDLVHVPVLGHRKTTAARRTQNLGPGNRVT